MCMQFYKQAPLGMKIFLKIQKMYVRLQQQ